MLIATDAAPCRRIYKSSSPGTSIYVYDGDNLIEETNSSGTAVARYSQGSNIDEPLAMLRAGATSFYHADGLGSVTSLTNGSGAIAQTYTFDSFGNLTGSSGSLTNPFRYTAREFDSETSLYYYRARYYDMNSGRFLSEDAVDFLAGDNFYSYVENSPTNATDPTGLDCRTWVIWVRCVDQGEPASILEAQRAHETQHALDNLIIAEGTTLLFLNPGTTIAALAAPRIPKACVAWERRGYAKEVPILKRRIDELEKKKCLTDDEKKELDYLNEELQTALNILNNWSIANDYCHAGHR